MSRRLLARGRALLGCALLATVTGAASCATNTSTVTVSGKTLTIYISAPAGLAGDPQAQDTIDAERLALSQLHGQVTRYALRVRTLTHDKLSDSARAAIENSKAIAYLGELEPGASADTIGITNAEDLLQVSPTDTAAELNQGSANNGYYEAYGTYGQTFARVVPSSAEEARAIVDEMQSLGVTTVYLANDGSAYGKNIANAVRSDVSAPITVASSPQSASAVFYGGTSASAAAALFNQVAQASPGVKLFAPSALAVPAFTGALSAAAGRRAYVSSPGFLPTGLPPAGRTFASAFRAAYGHAPATEAVFGYEAMAALLAVLHDAGAGANSRTTVVGDFLRLKRGTAESAVGAYSIRPNGDANIAGGGPFVFSRVKAGSLVPFKAVQAQG